MLVRLLVLLAAILPLCAQDSEVTKFLEEMRDNRDDARTQLLTALEYHPLNDERAAIQAALIQVTPQ
jgi:hypothetical protein